MPAKNKHTNNNFDGQLLHLQADAAFGRYGEAQGLIGGDYKEVLNLGAGYYMQAAGPRAAYRYAMPDNNVLVRHTGNKMYELADHLGNVRATVSDACKAVNQNGSWTSTAIVHNFNYYYPFGMPMPGLNGPANSTYRFGFNGQEKDDEIKGFGNLQDYGMRIYDTRIARFLSVDPITKDYPELTPYQFASNTLIQAIDLDGLEAYYSSEGELIGKYSTNTEIRILFDDYIEAAKNILNNSKNLTNAEILNNFLYNRYSAGTFNNPNDAANDWGSRYNKPSISENKEFSSIIFILKINGKNILSYTEPNKGNSTHISNKFKNSVNKKFLVPIHSHGAYKRKYDNNNFSKNYLDPVSGKTIGDINTYNQFGINGYVTTPNGSLQVFIYTSQQIELINCNMPSDINDPETDLEIEKSDKTLPKIINGNN